MELYRLIYGLGIRHVGEQTAKDIARSYGDVSSFDVAMRSLGDQVQYEELTAIDGIGSAAADAQGWFCRAVSTDCAGASGGGPPDAAAAAPAPGLSTSQGGPPQVRHCRRACTPRERRC